MTLSIVKVYNVRNLNIGLCARNTKHICDGALSLIKHMYKYSMLNFYSFKTEEVS